MKHPTIALVEVDGLHEQFDLRLALRPGLNVLYGKNGRGKTTLLHILANALELDFKRFQHLQFRRLAISTDAGNTVEIEKFASLGGQGLQVRVDGVRFGGESPIPQFDTEDQKALLDILGGRPVYLPAFRAILERVRSEQYAEPPRDGEYESIREAERQIERQQYPELRRTLAYLPGRDNSSMTARKTMQCREWFGHFIPTIRYPSIMEVTDRLTNEYRDAQVETGMQERRMLSEMFVEVFKALLSDEDIPSEIEVDHLMQRVRHALEAEETSTEFESYTDRIGSKLAQEMGALKSKQAHGGSAERRVLRLYAQMLERRNQERQSTFARVRQFEAAVNKFLDNKSLRVTDERVERSRRISGVFVETEGRKYPLGSLSSGERQVLTMLFSATRMNLGSGAFLIDEPELSLHIDWQRIILSELMTQAGERQIIACTHSPEVGADHMDSVQIFSPSTHIVSLPTQPGEGSDSTMDEML